MARREHLAIDDALRDELLSDGFSSPIDPESVIRRPPDADVRAAAALWKRIEEEIEQGRAPQFRHIAEVFGRVQPVAPPACVQKFLADHLSGLVDKKPRGQSTGAQRIKAYELLNRYAEIAAALRADGQRRYGLHKATLARLEAQDGHDMVRQYFKARALIHGPKSRRGKRKSKHR